MPELPCSLFFWFHSLKNPATRLTQNSMLLTLHWICVCGRGTQSYLRDMAWFKNVTHLQALHLIHQNVTYLTRGCIRDSTHTHPKITAHLEWYEVNVNFDIFFLSQMNECEDGNFFLFVCFIYLFYIKCHRCEMKR